MELKLYYQKKWYFRVPMQQKINDINRLFLHSLLLIGIVGTFMIFLIDIRNGVNDVIVIIRDLGVFLFLGISYFISKYYNRDDISVVFYTFTILSLMVYELLNLGGYNHGIGIIIIISLGYSYSFLLIGIVRNILHCITIFGLLTLLIYQYNFPEKFIVVSSSDLLGTAVPYICIYIIISYSAILVKDGLAKAYVELGKINVDLAEKNSEIETQNEEFSSQQEEMANINARLEGLVEERTHSLTEKNEALSRYAFRNAHNVRGPLARILGLLILHKIDDSISQEKLLEMIEIEAKDIDIITREIARDLGDNTE